MLALAFILPFAVIAENGPSLMLTDGSRSAKVSLPGYYLGPRFETAGSVTEFRADGHDYFSTCVPPKQRDPTANDHVGGIAESFFLPLGYDATITGTPFIVIGNGIFLSQAKPHFFFTPYTLKQRFNWSVETNSAASITFRQVSPAVAGYAYEYAKTITLAKNPNRLVIEYSLQNTGTKPFRTTQFAHNFLAIDHVPPGPDYAVTFAFAPAFKKPRKPSPFNGQVLTIRSLADRGYLTGFTHQVADNNVSLVYKPTGLGLRITGDYPPYSVYQFHNKLSICPEFFILVELQPGATAHWSRRYETFVRK